MVIRSHTKSPLDLLITRLRMILKILWACKDPFAALEKWPLDLINTHLRTFFVNFEQKFLVEENVCGNKKITIWPYKAPHAEISQETDLITTHLSDLITTHLYDLITTIPCRKIRPKNLNCPTKRTLAENLNCPTRRTLPEKIVLLSGFWAKLSYWTIVLQDGLKRIIF